MYMDDIKLFANNEKELETLTQTEIICSQEREIEFGIEKRAMQIIRSGKYHITEGIELSNQETIMVPL